MASVAGPTKPSWSHRPLQSFFRQWRSGIIGFPAPGSVSALADAWPCRSSVLCPCRRKRLRRLSSHGVRTSFTVNPYHLAAGLSAYGTSPGVWFPSAHRAREVTACRVGRLPEVFTLGILPAVPTPPTTVPLAGFPNLSAALLLLAFPPSFRRVTLLGFTLQGFSPPTKPRRLVAVGLPSCRCSRQVALVLILGEDTCGRLDDHLGSARRYLLWLQGLRLRGS